MKCENAGLPRALWLCAVFAALTATSPRAEEGVLVLGRISDDPARHYGQIKPLLDYVVPRMASVGIRAGRVLMAADAQLMQSYLRRGRVDWINETPAAAMLMAERADAQLLLVTEREGRASYRSVLFTRADSGMRSLADLRGRTIAFQNRISTSAYVVPAALLLEQGLHMELLASPLDPVPDDTVGYLFSRSDGNVWAWVRRGIVAAGATSEQDFDAKLNAAGTRADLVILARSAQFPRALEMVRGNLDARVRDRLREVLLTAAADPQGRQVLRQYMGTDGFHPPTDAELAALARVRAQVVAVKAKLE